MTSFMMLSSSAAFVAVPFDADKVAILIVVVTDLAADDDVSGAATDSCVAVSVVLDLSLESKI